MYLYWLFSENLEIPLLLSWRLCLLDSSLIVINPFLFLICVPSAWVTVGQVADRVAGKMKDVQSTWNPARYNLADPGLKLSKCWPKYMVSSHHMLVVADVKDGGQDSESAPWSLVFWALFQGGRTDLQSTWTSFCAFAIQFWGCCPGVGFVWNLLSWEWWSHTLNLSTVGGLRGSASLDSNPGSTSSRNVTLSRGLTCLGLCPTVPGTVNRGSACRALVRDEEEWCYCHCYWLKSRLEPLMAFLSLMTVVMVIL